MNARVMVKALVVLLTSTAPVFALDPAGQAVSVNQNAAASGTGGNRTLVTNGMLFTGDRITTDARGEAQLRLMDETRMIVGPNSNIGIDKFVISGPANGQKVAIDAAKGAFRFITGNAPKQAYEINTPVATISVRGTVFDFSSGPNGIAIMLYRDDQGGPSTVEWCEKLPPNSRAQPACYEISDACTLIVIPTARDYRVVTNVYEKTKMAQDLFPFLDKARVQQQFRVQSAECEHVDTTDPTYGYKISPFPAEVPADDPPPPAPAPPPACQDFFCP